ncbi:MAG: M36 family metallopeptidase [Saprospiraceae bacterium]|nr:M36 family metallopeptidase [Saprospiraceae bacterium]
MTAITFVTAQQNLISAKTHINQKAKFWGLDKDDYEDIFVSSEAVSEKGITYMYLNQAYKGIPIRNTMMTVIMDQHGKVVSDAHNLVAQIGKKINTLKPAVTPAAAIINSAAHLGIRIKETPVSGSRSSDRIQSYTLPELSKSPIPAQLKYELVDDKLVLVWNLNIDMANSADYWDMNIDAVSGEFVSKYNYTLYCKHHDHAYARHDDCGIKTFRKINNTQQSVSEILSGTAAKYNVFKLPAESPKHSGRSMASDDVYPSASPFGWHDTNGIDGPEHTITRGNNVYAYEDKNDDNQSDGNEPNGGQSLVFDYPFNINNDPRQSNHAAVTNLFYMCNMMHDVTFLAGFNEEFGNFQSKNYTGKADGNDFVQAQAFDGITLHEEKKDTVAGQPTKINNANFSTPSDGGSGTMQMYFWENQGGSVSIDAPEQLKGFVSEYGAASFGKVIPNSNEIPISGNLVNYKDGSANATQGCFVSVNSNDIKGKIALIDRGTCNFSTKVLNAQKAGAIAAIICNISGVNGGNGEELSTMSGGTDAGSVTIPSVFFKKSDCDRIRVALSNGATVTVTFQQRERVGAAFLDGSLDNGIIAHEYAHGISNRLTGGRFNTSCLTNDEQMGEGWSDFFALVMTHEPGDKGQDRRGIGTYASAQDITGGGIRRFPYSTDMNVNPQTFHSAKGTKRPGPGCNGCHALGEIWADVLWDMYWAFVDKYGYDADWKNQNSGNFKAMFLVMEGMKIQPCNPGFMDGRNAIIKADEIHFNSTHKCMLWNVFARRGFGYFADGGSKNDRDDGSENFESLPTCIEKLKIRKNISASVNPGGDATVELVVVNHIPARQNNVIITDQLENGMTYVNGSSPIVPEISGNVLTFKLGEMDYDKEIKISYKVKASKDNKSVRMSIQNFDRDFNWDIQKNEGNEDWLPNNDIYRSPQTSLHIINEVGDSDASLVSEKFEIKGKNPAVRFWHRYNTQFGNDGGFVEISVNNGPFVPVNKEKFIRNGYTGPLAWATIAIPSLQAFSGNSGGNWTGTNLNNGPWIDSYIDLSEYSGKTVIFRFRFASDASVKANGDVTGWFIDDFEIIDIFKYNTSACITGNNGTGEKSCTPTIQTLVNTEDAVSPADDFNEDLLSFKLRPNPAEDYVVFSAKTNTTIQSSITILSPEGRVMMESNVLLDNSLRFYPLDISTIPAGFYLVKLQSGNHVSTQKLIVK